MAVSMYYNYDFIMEELPWACGDEIKLHYITTLENQLCSMFVCDNMSNDMFRQVERCLIRYGECGAGLLQNGTLYADVATLGGDIDIYGYGTQGEIITRNGKETIRGKIGTDIIVGWNNSERVPTFDLYRYAGLFKELEQSWKNNVIYSRMHPVPVAKNSKMKQAIDKIIKDNKDADKTETVINDIPFIDQVNEKGVSIDVLTLTDPDGVERLQYLSKAYDDLLRRWWNLYGMDMQSTGKMAQQTTVELEGYKAYSMIQPCDMLKCRQDWARQINERFGTEFNYHFSPAWSWCIQDKQATEEVERMEGDETDGKLETKIDEP